MSLRLLCLLTLLFVDLGYLALEVMGSMKLKAAHPDQNTGSLIDIALSLEQVRILHCRHRGRSLLTLMLLLLRAELVEAITTRKTDASPHPFVCPPA